MLGKKDLFTAILAALALILIVLNIVTSSDKRNFDAEPYNTQLINQAELYSNSRLPGQTDKMASVLVGSAPAGTKIEVLEPGILDFYKVMLPDGTMGWVEGKNIKQSETVMVKYISDAACGLWDAPNYVKGKQIRRISEREMLTIIDGPEQVNNTLAFYKVKDKNDTIGWINESYLSPMGWEVPRFVDRKTWRYKKDSFEEDWIGKPVGEFIEKFAEPGAIKNESGKKTYYFNNIYLYKDDHKYIGQQLVTQNGIIEEVKYSGTDTKWTGYFPLSNELRSNFFMNTIWDLANFRDYERLDKYGDSKATQFDSKWVRILVAILFIILILSLFYIILYIPYFVTDKTASRLSLNPKLSNSIIKTIVLVGTAVLGYLWFVFISVNIGVFNEYFLIFMLFSLGMAMGLIGMWSSSLLYNRCRKCHLWTGSDNGSEMVAAYDHTRTSTGSSGYSKSEHGRSEIWIDHRLCTNCGFMWDIRRRFWSGWR
ncbi:MAG TPA: SH3 domain-containing protein [Bacteroidales bacterium]